MLMGNRKHPFGYTMQCGRYVVCNSEADTIRSIFTMYAHGKSFSEIANTLIIRSIEYSNECLWNKNIIARILEDSRYIGHNGYPPIVSEQEFYSVARMRRAKVQPDMRTAAQKVLRKKCSSPPTPSTEVQVMSILNILIKHPDLIHAQDDPYHNDKVGTLQGQLDTVMMCQPIDEAVAIKLISEIAAEQYSQIDDSVYETERLHRLMLRFEPADELNAELLAKSIDRILVYKNSIQVILKNGQIINSEEVL